MTIRYTDNFLRQLKKSDVRIRKVFKERLVLFEKNPSDPKLNDHTLQRDYQGYSSIDITNNYRAIFKEVVFEDDTYIYFSSFGTHEELYNELKAH